MSDPAARRVDPVAVVQRIYIPLLRLAQAIAGREDAEDLVQQTLVEILRRHPAFEGVDHPLGYGRVILIRLASGLTTQRHRERALMQAVAALGPLNATPGETGHPREFLARLSSLGDKQRACVFLKYFCDLDDKSIGTVLGCRPSTVRSQLARAISHLRLIEKKITLGGNR